MASESYEFATVPYRAVRVETVVYGSCEAKRARSVGRLEGDRLGARRLGRVKVPHQKRGKKHFGQARGRATKGLNPFIS